MKLITEKIRKRLEKYPLYSQNGKGKEAIVVVKFFLCVGTWTWYILEADLESDTAFGIVINGSGEGEYSYFDLKELQGLITRQGLFVERDTSFSPKPLSDVNDQFLQKFLSNLYDE